ncbi:MAG TPA: hypothetical protein VKA83_09390 [Methylomirabilota bacterium]|nr:hypothetical protein [Methylomirabilota bacterium]
MPRTATANYDVERPKLATAPRYFIRPYHVKTYGAGTDYAFSRDFSTGDVGAAATPKYPWLFNPSGNTQVIEAELGRSSIGTMVFRLLDKGGEVLKYLSNPELTLNGAHGSGDATIIANQSTEGYPAVGTIEITTAGVIERVRYTGKTFFTFTGCTRGVDGTSAAAHSNGDGVRNGEELRAGNRIQLYCGYAPLAEADYMSFVKMEIVKVSMLADRVTFEITCQDVQRTLRRSLFIGATQDIPVVLAGNPVDIGLACLISAGTFSTRTGTVSTTPGDATVTGAGTSFTTELSVGDAVYLASGEIVRVGSITDNTHFEAAQNCILSGSGLAFQRGGASRWDILPAVSGLAVPSALVDVTAIEAVRDANFTTSQYQFSITSPFDGKTFIEEQIWRTLNCYPVVTQDGKLSAKRYKVAVSSPTVTLNADEIIAASWLRADEQVINVIKFNYDYNIAGAAGIYGTRRTYEKGTVSDPTMSIGKYGRKPPIVISSLGIRSALGGSTIADERALEIIRRYAEPQSVIQVDVLYRNHKIEPGDQILFTDARMPNRRTGLRGFTAEVFEILDMTPQFGASGGVRLSLFWVAAVASQSAPTAVSTDSSTIPYLTGPVTEQDLDEELGVQVAAFAWYHSVLFGAGTPRDSWREATVEFAYTQVTGDRLEYDILFRGNDSTLTEGGFDVAAIERGPENAASATSTTLVLNAAASGSDNTYNDMWIEILSNGTPAANGQTRKVTAYVGSTKTATVAAWTTTPTGTISYRIIRTGARDFGNDQNGASGKPTTALGSGALEQWMHRTISLPAAWDGKTIIGAATAMEGAQASQTQTMLVRNAVITSTAVGNPAALIFGRYAFSDQGVWKYGSESNATTTKRIEVIGGATPTPLITNLAVNRGGAGEGSLGVTTDSGATETIAVTLPALDEIVSLNDIVRWWIRASISFNDAFSRAVALEVTWRVRHGGLTGAILQTWIQSLNGGVKGGGTSMSSVIPAIFSVFRPAATGLKDVVLTYQRTGANAASSAQVSVAYFQYLSLVKSA